MRSEKRVVVVERRPSGAAGRPRAPRRPAASGTTVAGSPGATNCAARRAGARRAAAGAPSPPRSRGPSRGARPPRRRRARARATRRGACAARGRARARSAPSPSASTSVRAAVGHAGRQDAADEVDAVRHLRRQRRDDRDQACAAVANHASRTGVVGRRTAHTVAVPLRAGAGRGGARLPCRARGSRAPGRRPRAAVSSSGISALPSRTTEISRAPSAARAARSRLPCAVRVLVDRHLDDLEVLLAQLEQVDQAVLRHLVLDQPMIDAGRRDRRRDPEQVEVRLVARVVDARDHLLDAVAARARAGR